MIIQICGYQWHSYFSITFYFLITIPSTSNRITTSGSSKKGSHVYFLLIVAMVLVLWCQIVLLWHQVTMVASEQHLYQTIVQFDKTIVLPRKLATRGTENLCHFAGLQIVCWAFMKIWHLLMSLDLNDYSSTMHGRNLCTSKVIFFFLHLYWSQKDHLIYPACLVLYSAPRNVSHVHVALPMWH